MPGLGAARPQDLGAYQSVPPFLRQVDIQTGCGVPLRLTKVWGAEAIV